MKPQNPNADQPGPTPGPLALVTVDKLPGNEAARDFIGADHNGLPISIIIIDHKPGDGPELHRHDYPEVIIVIDGEMTITDGEHTVIARAGDIAIAPAGRPHAFTNTGTEQLRSIDIHLSHVFRTDWLRTLDA
jgi:quercetin dioxygenase-like cupin family protein